MTLEQYKLLRMIDDDLREISLSSGAVSVRGIESIHHHFDKPLQDIFGYHGTLAVDCKSLTRDGVLSVLLEVAK